MFKSLSAVKFPTLIMSEATVGEKRVRTAFNPDAVEVVDVIKQKSAELINLCRDLPSNGDPEVERLKSIAQTSYEESAMWAVKAATGVAAKVA